MTIQHFEEAKQIWKEDVPSEGQAATVQGELIRAIEKLRDEAQRNANDNWSAGSGHEILACYIRDILINSSLFDKTMEKQIRTDIDRLLDFIHPETSDEPYDRLTDRSVEWARAHPQSVPHKENKRLIR